MNKIIIILSLFSFIYTLTTNCISTQPITKEDCFNSLTFFNESECCYISVKEDYKLFKMCNELRSNDIELQKKQIEEIYKKQGLEINIFACPSDKSNEDEDQKSNSTSYILKMRFLFIFILLLLIIKL